MKKSFFTRSCVKIALVALALIPTFAFSATYTVSTVADLRAKIAAAASGDVILVAPGTYAPTDTLSTNTMSQSNGGMNRIVAAPFIVVGKTNLTIKAEIATNKPIIQGLVTTGNDYIFYAKQSDGLRIENIVFRTGAKGVIIDRSDNVVFTGNVIENVGEEGLHYRDSSDNGKTLNNTFRKIGMERKDRGEAIYICNDKKKWHPNHLPADPTTDDKLLGNCDNHEIANNVFDGNIGGEHIDLKEGTRGHNIHHNTFKAFITDPALIAAPGDYAPSLIHDKSYNSRIHNNTFDLANMIWIAATGDYGVIRMEQVLVDTVDAGWDLYGHNGGYVYNTITNSNTTAAKEFVALCPGDGGNNAKVGCDTINGVNSKYRVTSASKCGFFITGNIGDVGTSVVSGTACNTYVPSSSGGGSSAAASSAPASSTPASSTPASSAAASSVPAGGSCVTVSGTVATEVNLTGKTCVDMTSGLSGKRFAVWDSDTNTSCNWRGNAVPQSGGTTLAVTSDYVITATPSGWSGTKVNMTDNNGCKFVKVRVF